MKVYNIQNYNTSFGIKISPDFIKAADEFYVQHNKQQDQFNKIYRKAKYMEENYGFDEYTIIASGFTKNGKRLKALFAVKDDNSQKPVLLAAKDSMKKLFERFTHINEYELNNRLL